MTVFTATWALLKEWWYIVVDRFTDWRIRWFGTYTQPPIDCCDQCGAEPQWVLVGEVWDEYACEAHKDEGLPWQRIKGR